MAIRRRGDWERGRKFQNPPVFASSAVKIRVDLWVENRQKPLNLLEKPYILVYILMLFALRKDVVSYEVR
jgi:hypothetical protein